MLGLCRTKVSSSLPRLAKLCSFRTLSTYYKTMPRFCLPLGAHKQNNILNASHQYAVTQCSQWRNYAHVSAADMNQAKVTERVMTVIKLFEKISADKLTMESHFMKELGLDSLDHVELLMAVEDEFGFEIPDQDAEKLNKPSDIIQYLCQKLEIDYQ